MACRTLVLADFNTRSASLVSKDLIQHDYLKLVAQKSRLSHQPRIISRSSFVKWDNLRFIVDTSTKYEVSLLKRTFGESFLQGKARIICCQNYDRFPNLISKSAQNSFLMDYSIHSTLQLCYTVLHYAKYSSSPVQYLGS